MEQEPSPFQELDARTGDGLLIQLLWSRDTNETFIRIEDQRKEEVTQYAVLGGKAIEAFNHPFAFIPKPVVQ